MTYSECDCLSPREGTRCPRVVGDPDGEGIVATVCRQQILAGPLEVENSAVESPVVRVSKHGAHCII